MRAYVYRLIQSSSPARSAHWGPRLSLSSPEAGTASAVLNGQGRERCSVTQATTRAEARLPGHPGRPVLPASLRQLRHCDSCAGTETARPAPENICWPGPRHWGALETSRPSRPPAAAARGPAPPRLPAPAAVTAEGRGATAGEDSVCLLSFTARTSAKCANLNKCASTRWPGVGGG